MRYLILFLLCFIFVYPVMGGESNASFDYEDCEDTYVINTYDGNQDDNHGTADYLLAKRTDETSGDRKGSLVYFDISTISATVTVDSVDFAMSSYYTLSATSYICRMTTDWEEGNANDAIDAEGEYGATWNYANDDYDDDADPACVDMDWDDGDFGTGDYDDNSGSYYDTQTSHASTNIYRMHFSGDDMEDIVEGWINGTYNNYGFLIFGDETQACFCSSENGTEGYRPTLYIEYTEAATTTPQVIIIEVD